MDEPKHKMSTEHGRIVLNPFAVKKPKKRSIVERELETNLTARITSPVTGDGVSTSRYGRARRIKTAHDSDRKISIETLKSSQSENTPVKIPISKPVLNSPCKAETPKKALETSLDNINQDNKALSRFDDQLLARSSSSSTEHTKVYIRKDLIQNRDDEDDIILIKDLFSPPKSGTKPVRTDNQSTVKYSIQNGHISNTTVVKTLDFDGNKCRKGSKDVPKNELFNIEARCPYQVGDLAWARMGTFPFWPCIITRDPASEMFVRKKLFGRIEHDIIHVTFFADNGRHNWVVDNMLRKYSGPAELVNTREKFTAEDKKKDPRLYAAFFISEKKQTLWSNSVEEAEMIQREPKRLRIEIFNDLLQKARASKKQLRSGKVTRTDSDVSLSESLYDSLFSEDDSKSDESKTSRNRSKNPKIDVSDVVTACLDNMAAKTGNIKIQRQSHMDRWLQKAKSKTPEKVKTLVAVPKIETVTPNTDKDIMLKVEKLKPSDKSSNRNKRKRPSTKPPTPVTKVYSLRRSYEPQIPQNNVSENQLKVKNEQVAKNESKIESDFMDDTGPEHVDSSDCDVIISKDAPVVIDLINEEMNDSVADADKVPFESTKDKSTDYVVYAIDDLLEDKNRKDETFKSTEESDTVKVHILKNEIGEEQDSKTTDEDLITPTEETKTNVVPKSIGIYLEFKKKLERLNTDSPKSTNNNDKVVAEAINTLLDGKIKSNDQPLLISKTTIVGNVLSLSITEPCKDSVDKNNDLSVTSEKSFVETKVSNRTEENKDVRSEKNILEKSEERYYVDECKSSCNVQDAENSILINTVQENQVRRGSSVETMEISSVKDGAEYKMSNTAPVMEKQVSGSSPVTNEQNASIMEISSLTPQDSDNQAQISETNTDEKNGNKTVIDTVSKLSPRKGDAMVLIPGRSDDDSNLDSEFNVHTIDLQDHNSNLTNISIVKSKNEIKNTTEEENIDQGKSDIKSNENYHNMSIDKSLSDEDITMSEKCDISNESGNSESILELVNDISDILKDKYEEKEEICVSLNKTNELLESCCNELADSTKPIIEIKTVEKSCSIESNNFLEQVNTGPVVKDLLSDNKDTYFREVNISKPPDLISGSLTAKTDLLLDIQNDSEEDGSDEEPSPEYEPLGDEITEDFRQHLKCIESHVMDKKDDAQLVKVCDEIVYIEESKMKLADLKFNISPIKECSFDKNHFKAAKSPVKETIKADIEDENNQIESDKCKHVETEKSIKLNEDRNSEVKKEITIIEETDNIDLTKEVKAENLYLDPNKSNEANAEKSSVDQNKPNKLCDAYNILGSFKSPPVKKSLSLKKDKHRTPDPIDTKLIINDRYKTIDQIEEIISSKREPKRLPIENGEVNIPEIKENGYSDKHNDTPDLNDDDFDIDDVSVNSEDSEISLPNSKFLLKIEEEMPRRSLRPRARTDKKVGLENPEFLTYYELNVDNLMEEYPELSQDDLLLYCYQTFLYKENLKSDSKQTEEMQLTVQGIKQETPSRKKTKKPQPQPKNTLENLFREKYKNAKKIDFDSDIIEAGSSESVEDNTPKSEVYSVNPVDSGIGKDREETPIAKRKTKSQLLQLFTGDVSKEIKTELINDSVQIEPIASSPKKCSKEIKTELIKEAVHIEITTSSPKTPKLIRTKTISPKDLQKSGKRIPVVVISPIKAERTVEFIGSDCDLPLRQLRSKVVHDNKFNELKKEIAEQSVKDEVETVSVCSDNEPLLTLKPKVNKIENTNDDPEFVKYLELKMDAIIDENPQLSYDEIQEYLHKVYIHENSSKTEIQKNEEIESSNLVKGLGQETQPTRKPRRKPKLEKLDDEEIISKEKPKRKTVQHYYNEAFISDFEDELEVFEIFKTKKSPITVVSKAEPSPKKETIETKAEDSDNSDESTEEIISTMDEIELYFKQLTSPKPNVFKGLAREKVCEICEDVSDLIKCKGCNGTFHYDCVNTVTKEVETPVNTDKRGRKKKKLGRKRKSQEPESDERHDISEDNISMDDIQSCTFDAANLEAQLEAKMKELLDKEKNINYDSYSSDDGIDWTETVAGKCEIVDVKLKLRTPPIDYANFKCKNCRKYSTPVCFVCKSAVSKTDVKIRQKCSVSHCHSYYHVQCLDHWPQTQFNAGEITRSKKANEQFEALTCPRHVCHTCVSDDPRGCKTRFCGDKLARCVRCPATYHTFNRCLPAGTQILTASLIICPRHYEHRPGKVPCHVNTGWCFICALGGSLICCEYCPTSFHPDCLNIKPPEGNYMCEDCETGRLPLYGEMVWVKLGHYRWWPGVVLHPSEIPDNIMAVTHGLGEFVVRFFGQYDHYWVNRGRVFPYQEGDSGRISGQKSKIDADFTTAMEHAQKAFEILKNSVPDEDEESDIAASLLPPHYIKLKCNKPIGSLCGRKIEDPSLSLTQCECDPNEIEPCGPNKQCLNRVLLTECGPTCRAAERCHNRAFEKRFYPKLAPYKAPHRGWGLKTLEDIKAGQFVIEYVGELIDQEEFQRRMRRKHEIRDENFYFLTLDKERMIDAGPKGNLARFMNHCCEPNCETQKWTVLGDIRVGLFAIDDIPANSEVTFNYNLECTGIEKKQCLCGAQRCSGYIGAKPKQDQSQRKKKGFQKRVYKKRKNIEESPSTSKNKVKKPVGRPPKPKELTEIEKDLFIIKNATTSSGESSRRHSLEDKTKIKTDSNSTEQSTASKETDAECKKELKINNANSESTISNNIDYENHIPRPVKIKIKLGNSPEENTSEVVSNFSETSKKKALKKKIDFNSLQQVSIPNGVISSEACKNNKALKRKIDCIPTKNVSISIEPSAKKQKCDKPMVGD